MKTSECWLASFLFLCAVVASTVGRRLSELVDPLLSNQRLGVLEALCMGIGCTASELQLQDANAQPSTRFGTSSSFLVASKDASPPTCLTDTMHALEQGFRGDVPQVALEVKGGSYVDRSTGTVVLQKLVAGVNSGVFAYKSEAGKPWPNCSLDDVVMKVHSTDLVTHGWIVRDEWRYRRRSPSDICDDETMYQNRAADVGAAPRIYQQLFCKETDDSKQSFCVHATQKASGPSITEWLRSEPSKSSRKAWANHYKVQVWKMNSNGGITHNDLHVGNAMFDCPGGVVTEAPSDTCKLLIVDFEFANDRSSSWFVETGDRKETQRKIKKGLID